MIPTTFVRGAFASDPASPNQVRHFVGWFAAGYLGITRADTRRRLYNSEGGQSDPTKSVDVALGLAAIELGENSEVTTRNLPKMSGTIYVARRATSSFRRDRESRIIGA